MPLADESTAAVAAARDPGDVCDAVLDWLNYASPLFPHIRLEQKPAPRPGAAYLDFVAPTEGRAYLRVVGPPELEEVGEACVARVLAEAAKAGASTAVLLLNCDLHSGGQGSAAAESLLDDDLALPSGPLLLEPRWVAALALERAKPMVPTDERAAAALGGSPYFEGEPEPGSGGVRIVGTTLPPAFLVGHDSGIFRQKLESAQRQAAVGGTILLASVFFPPVTQSVRAQRRFYEFWGATPETIGLVEQRATWERDRWLTHIRRHQRRDVLDLAQVQEYLAAPEYYQLPLTKAELAEQVENIVALLGEPNYELRFATEAVDLPFEIVPDQVRIRTDRRNKGQPRQGRLASIALSGRAVIDTFEREFWTLYRSAGPDLIQAADIAAWLQQAVKNYSGHTPVRSPARSKYDVFLCYNNADVATVQRLARRLEKVGIRPWFDCWDAPPGVPAIMALESVISEIDAAAVFVGDSGIGPWQQLEIYTLLSRFVKRNCRVFPVLLGTAPNGPTPEVPPFLETLGWVDFRRGRMAQAFDRFIWGVDPSRQPSH